MFQYKSKLDNFNLYTRGLKGRNCPSMTIIASTAVKIITVIPPAENRQKAK